MKNEPLVCIVVLNWNGGEMPIKCIDGLLNNTNYKNFKIIFVDNGSVDGSDESVQRKFHDIKLIKLKQNFGFSKGMNVGAWHSLKNYNPKYIIFLNNDISFPSSARNWLPDLVKDMEDDQNVAIAAPRIKGSNGRIEGVWTIKGRIFVRRYRPNTTERKKCSVTYCTGACFLIRSSVLKEIGLYDERFSPYGFEDMDLFLRVKKAGHSIIYDPRHTLIHGSSMTIKKLIKSQLKKSIIIYNKNLLRNRYKNYAIHVFLLSLFGTLARSFVIYGPYMKFFRCKGKFKIINLNPSFIFQFINQIDLRQEKVKLSSTEVAKRISYIS